MDPQAELTLLETAYTGLITGGIQSYNLNGRMVTRIDAKWMTTRMDQLRAIVWRMNNGMMTVAQNRPPE